MPTAKRQKYLDRLASKQSSSRTQEERQTEYDKFMGQFAQLGLNTEFEEIAKFDTMAKDWVTNGTVYQGVIPLVGMKRDLVYTLTNNKKHEIGVMLKSTEENTSTSDTQTSSVATNKTATPLKRMVTKKVAAKPPQAQSA
jgi:predicted DNA repair protein MutK